MKYPLFLTLIIILCAVEFSDAQISKPPINKRISFGPQIGVTGEAIFGDNVYDSVRVNTEVNGLTYPYLSFFVEKPLTDMLRLRAEITYIRSSAGFIVYDLHPDSVLGTYAKKSFSNANNLIQIPVTLNLRIPGLRFLSILGGIDSHIQFGNKRAEVKPNRSINSKEAAIMNALNNTTRAYVPYYIIGARIDVKRFSLTARYEENLTRTYLKDMKINERSYAIPSRKTSIYLTLGYHFYSLKRKGKQE